MNSNNYHTKTIILLLTLLVSHFGFSQYSDEVLPNTVIFKVKEQHRNSCLADKIEIMQFNRMLTQIDVVKLEKIFPNKTKEKKEGNIDLSLIYTLEFSDAYSIDEVIRKIKKLKISQYVEPYFIPQLTYTPNDTLISDQYYINLIQAENAWDINKGDTNIVIGITDTGWDTAHPDLIGNVKINYNDPINGLDDDGDGFIDNFMGWDLGMDDNDAMWESSAHGTNVSGIAAATTNNVTGISGVGFNTKFLPIKISNSAGILTQAYQGIVYAADHDCFAINCSWGGFNFSEFNQDVIDYATINKGSLVIGAIGNNDLDVVFYPAGYDGVLNVAASEQSDLKKDNSNFGFYVDVSAPGEAMRTTSTNGGFGYNGGTSMAAPVVTGAAGLLKAQFPTYNNYQIAALIQATADDMNLNNPSYIDKLGSGRLNLFNAVSATAIQFLEITHENISDNNDNNFNFGDTLFIEAFFKNYLDPISATSVTLSSTSSYVNVIDGATNLLPMGTLGSSSNGSDKFKVEVLNGIPLNEKVIFKAIITNGTYVNNEYFTVTLNPDYINLAENLVSTTITSNGKIGYNDINNSVGLGFEYDGQQLLFEAGLMIGDGTDRVADVVRGDSGPDQDFDSQQNIGLNPPYASSLDLYNILNDNPLINSMNFWVEQFSYAYAPNDKYVIIVYKINNLVAPALSNLHAGIFADWDIDGASLNKSGYDASRKMGFVHSLGSDTIYAAIKLLSSGNAINYSLNLDGSGGVNPNGGFSTSEKFTTLSTSRNSAGGVSGADVAHVVSTGGINLNEGEDVVVAFALIAGDSLLDIQNSADAAQIRYNNDALHVDEVETMFNDNIYPNPTTGLIKVKTSTTTKSIVVRNVLGEIIKTSVLNAIDLSLQPNGIYFINVTTEGNSFTKKLILSK